MQGTEPYLALGEEALGSVGLSAASCSNNVSRSLEHHGYHPLPHSLSQLTLTTSLLAMSAPFNYRLQAKIVYIQVSTSSLPFITQTAGIWFRPNTLLGLFWSRSTIVGLG